MNTKYKIFTLLLALYTISFSESDVPASDEAQIKERGIEKLNFYYPVKEQNKFSSFSEFDFRADKNIYQWTLAEGYQAINSKWDFNYKIEKEYHNEKHNDKANYHVWDNEISIVRNNKSKTIGNSVWAFKTFFKIKHDETDGKDILRTADYKFYLGQRISSFFPLGKGGTYAEFEMSGGGVNGNLKNGYSLNIAAKTNSNLGYGIQWSNNLENEYMNYNQYKKTLKIKWETVLRWTYELNENFAFSPELNFKVEKYFPKKQNDYNIELTVGPYILYSKNIKENFRLYGKIGLPLYRFDKIKAKDYYSSKSKLAVYAKFGVEYIF